MHRWKKVRVWVWVMFFGICAAMTGPPAADADTPSTGEGKALRAGGRTSQTAPKDLTVWKKELQQKRRILEETFMALLDEKSLIEMKQKSLQPEEDPAALESAVLTLKEKVDAYEAQRRLLEQDAAAYNQAVARHSPVIIRERVVYKGPKKETSDEKEEESEATAGAGSPPGAEASPTAESLIKRKSELDAEYKTLLEEKEALVQRQADADSEEESRQVNEEIDRFNTRLGDYNQRRQTLNEAVVRFNKRQVALETKTTEDAVKTAAAK